MNAHQLYKSSAILTLTVITIFAAFLIIEFIEWFEHITYAAAFTVALWELP
jgi:hypothetical protein